MAFKTNSYFISISATLVASSFFSASAFVQTNNEDKIEVIEVHAQNLDGLGMSPKNALIDGPFGDGVALQDIPRSLTVISSVMMEQLNITTLQDLSILSPNAYSASGFGAPSLPTLRGQLGELFQDGIRRQAGNNGFGIPLTYSF